MPHIYDLVDSEMFFGKAKYGRYHDAHHQYGALLEEVAEWFDEIRANTEHTPEALYELVQIAAVALRYVLENGDIDEINKIQETRHSR